MIRVRKKGRPVFIFMADIRNLETEGRIENAWLLFRGEADYALIQNDVATHAVTGKGQFGRCGPLSNLRALGSLFPEPVHIIVPSYSRILAIRDLRGKRVSIGMPNSGTQYDALAVLKSEGLPVIDLKEASQEPFEEAMNRMMQGLIDAVFVTTGAPNRTLQELSARNKIRLVPVQSRSIARLAPGNSGLIKFTLPANSYPGQTEDGPAPSELHGDQGLQGRAHLASRTRCLHDHLQQHR